uniref:Ig-like domain-containing protein n=1 Tax=Anser cygnoides TaxID=8845 RepID=A0A8B9EK76_ANSCY
MELLPRRPAWPLTCLVLLSLRAWPGAGAQAGQGFELRQPQKEMSVIAGETLTLTCTVTEGGPIGPVRWLKGWGSGNETIYDQKEPSSSRGTMAVDQSNTDFTILIRDVRLEDAGTYYCVKFRKTDTSEELYRRGEGTVVSVQARPSNPTVSGPSHRAEPGKTASFTCKTGGFFPSDIRVKWFKDRAPIQAQPIRITPGPSNFTYNMSSTVTVTLQKDDIRSELTCEVQHATLTAPLNRSYHLSQILRVPPNVLVAQLPDPVGLNKTVNFTCDVQGFYPGSVSVTWLENGTEMNTGSPPRPTETPKGLFELRSTVAVQAVQEKNGSVFTCRVVHEGRDPIIGRATLRVAALDQKESNSPNTNGSSLFIYVAVGVVCTVLALLVVAILFLIRAKQSKGKSSPSARLHEPEKSSGTTTQESDPNNLTYADLNFTKEKKNIQRIIETWTWCTSARRPGGPPRAPRRPPPSMPASRSSSSERGCTGWGLRGPGPPWGGLPRQHRLLWYLRFGMEVQPLVLWLLLGADFCPQRLDFWGSVGTPCLWDSPLAERAPELWRVGFACKTQGCIAGERCSSSGNPGRAGGDQDSASEPSAVGMLLPQLPAAGAPTLPLGALLPGKTLALKEGREPLSSQVSLLRALTPRPPRLGRCARCVRRAMAVLAFPYCAVQGTAAGAVQFPGTEHLPPPPPLPRPLHPKGTGPSLRPGPPAGPAAPAPSCRSPTRHQAARSPGTPAGTSARQQPRRPLASPGTRGARPARGCHHPSPWIRACHAAKLSKEPKLVHPQHPWVPATTHTSPRAPSSADHTPSPCDVPRRVPATPQPSLFYLLAKFQGLLGTSTHQGPHAALGAPFLAGAQGALGRAVGGGCRSQGEAEHQHQRPPRHPALQPLPGEGETAQGPSPTRVQHPEPSPHRARSPSPPRGVEQATYCFHPLLGTRARTRARTITTHLWELLLGTKGDRSDPRGHRRTRTPPAAWPFAQASRTKAPSQAPHHLLCVVRKDSPFFF